MASNEYLNELASVFLRAYPIERIPIESLESELDTEWNFITNEDNIETQIENLRYMADVAFSLVARLKDEHLGITIANAMMLHDAKNRGYAGQSEDPWANFRLAEQVGVKASTGVLVRLSDKYARWQSLSKNPNNDLVGESILDTLNDLGAYALIGVCLFQEEIQNTTKRGQTS